MRNIFTKTVALMAMSVMTVAAWATPTPLSIPQELGNYIGWNNADVTGATVENEGANIGSTGKNTVATFALTNSTEQDYLFTFFSGSRDQAGKVSFTLSDGGTYNVKKEFDISDTDAWSLTERHIAVFTDVPATSLTLTFKVESDGSGYYGNYGNVSFTGANQIPMPDSESNKLDVTRATTSGMKINGTYLTEISTNSYADDMYMYITDAGYYQVYVGYGYATAGTDQFTITITDLATGTAEVNAQNYTVTSSMRYLMKDRISSGWKKIRLDHPITPASGSFRMEKMFFIPVQMMPVVITDSVNVRLATVSNIKINDNYLTEIKAGSYADDIYMEVTEDGYYQVHAGYGYASAGTDQFTITITDVNTDEAEVDAKNYTLTSGQNYLMSDYITAGLKKIRLDHPRTPDQGSFRLEHMYFIPIQTMPDSPTNLLDVTNASVSGMKINGTYLTEITVGSYADDIYVNFEQGGYFQVHAGYGWKTAGTDNFTITITDVNTSTNEVDAKNFVVTEGENYLMTDYVSAGLKKIRLYYPGPTITASFRLENMYFDQIPNLPLTGTATLNLDQTGRVFNECRMEDDALAFIKNGGYADNYIVYNNMETYYTLHLNISWYKQGGKIKITVTDIATDNVEVNAQESSEITSTGDVQFALNNTISAGFKKIRFDFVKDGESGYLFNIKDVSFSAAPYTRTHPHMNLNTLCFPYQIDTYEGATFYTMLYKVEEASVVTDVYLQEHVGALEAGVPYFYVPEGEELVCYYSGAREDTPAKVNGVQGFYENLTTIPEGSYVAYNDLLTIVGDNVRMGEYRAYVDMSAVAEKDEPGAPALVPGRRLLNIGGHKTPTGVENTSAAAIYGGSQKILRNGQLYIMYNGQMYNVQGQLVK